MKKRMLRLLLTVAVLLSLLCPAVSAQEEGSFAFVAASATNMAVAPTRISYLAGQSLRDALRESGYSFVGLDSSYVQAINGVEGRYSVIDDVGAYDLDKPAAGVKSLAFVGVEVASENAGAFSAMVQEMAGYNLLTNGVQKYAPAQAAYEAARKALFVKSADYSALAASLQTAVKAYEDEVLNGEKQTLDLQFTTLSGQSLSGWTFAATDAYGTVSEFQNEPVALIAGTYTFELTAADGANSARGSLTVEPGGAVRIGGEICKTICVYDGQWVQAPVLRRGADMETGVFACLEDGAFSASYTVPDNFAGNVYIYAAPGSGITEDGDYTDETVGLTVCYLRNGAQTESTKPWASKNAAVNQLVSAGSQTAEATAEARYSYNGYTVVQSYTMQITRTPTLQALRVSCGGVEQNIGFSPDEKNYTCSVTASSAVLSASAFSQESELFINDALVTPGQAVTVEIPRSGAQARIRVRLPSGAEETYTITFSSVPSVLVKIAHEAGTSIAVYNAAGAQIGASETTATSASFPLTPGETCSYVATRETYFHTTKTFTAADGLALTAKEPQTESWLTACQIRNRINARLSDAFLAPEDFSQQTHAYNLKVIDTQTNLYLWGKEDGYQITEPTTGTVIESTMSGQGTNLANFLKQGSQGCTLTIRVAKADDAESYQDYLFHITRTLSFRDGDGLQATVDGQKAPLYQVEDGTATKWQGFDNEILSYEIRTVRAAKTLGLTMLPFGEDYVVRVNGQEITPQADGSVVAELPLMTDQDEQTFQLQLTSAGAADAAQTYQIRVVKANAIETTLTLKDSKTGAALKKGLIALYDKDSGARLWPEDGVFRLADGVSYRYVATCTGYVGEKGEITASADQAAQTISLAPAPAQRKVAVSSSWPSFRGKEDSNGVVSVKTPIDAQKSMLSWAAKLGQGYSGEALGCPILITEDGYDYLIVYETNHLKKVDALSGTVVAVADMDHASDFAINSATYAEGMLFVGLANGGVQAFYADTLESAWLYTGNAGEQANCPITYHDGYIYTGFWVQETQYANYVCLSITDEDPAQTKEEKLPTWTYSSKGGFYWAGAYVTDDYLLVGTDDGDAGCTSETSALLCLDPRTGRELDRIGGLKGDIRCSIAKYEDRFYFTSKGGCFYSVRMTKDAGGTAKIDHESLKTVLLDNGANDPAHPPMSTCTPVLYNNRAYIGVSGTSQFGAYSGHNITVIDLSSWSIAYKVPTQGYPQTSGLLTTAYNTDGSVYVYFFDNYTPGKLRMLKDAPGQTSAELVTTETYNDAGYMQSINTAYVLFTPRDAQAQYAICSPITDAYGTLYFKNDSAHLMAFSGLITKAEVLTQPEKTVYTTDDEFDPTGMTVRLTYENGMTRDIPARRTVNGVTIDYFTWNDLSVDTADDFLITYKYALYQDAADGTQAPVTGAQFPLKLTVSQGSGEQNSCVYADELTGDIEIKTGEEYTLALGTVFQDEKGHSLTYTLDETNYGSRVLIESDTLHFSVPDAGTYTLTLRAACTDGKRAKLTLKIVVSSAQDGSQAQYSYDETPADFVDVIVTVSNDGIPLRGNDGQGTALSHLEVRVPYFDLDLYGLGYLARRQTADGKGNYVSTKVVERPTALHLYIYLLERYYMGLPEEKCCKGTSGVLSYLSARDVLNLYGQRVNDAKNFSGTSSALTLKGSATSLYMSNFWGHDENLMYYRNHVYPLMSAGWGATCDYMLLSSGDTMDLAMFTNWSFYRSGAFSRFDKDAYTTPAEEGLKVQTLKYDTRSVSDGGTESFTKIENMTVSVWHEDWTAAAAGEYTLSGEKGSYSVTFAEPGTYYLLATAEGAGTDQANTAPAMAKVVVTEKQDYKLGDLNGDKKINAFDLMILRRALVGLTTLSDTQKKAIDLNKDGKINAFDLMILRRYLVGLVKEL